MHTHFSATYVRMLVTDTNTRENTKLSYYRDSVHCPHKPYIVKN